MDSSTYRHLMGQIKNSCIIPHHNFPCHNLLDIETLNEISADLNNPDEFKVDKDFLCNFPCYKSFDYNVEYSAPLYCGSGVTDVALGMVNRKLRWEKKLKDIKVPTNAKKAAKDLRQFEKGNLAKVSRSLTYLLRHFDKDPSPDFSGNYNWLYTGGNLICKKINNNVFLLGADYNQTGLNVLKLNDEMSKIECKTTFGLKTSSPVFQICASVNQGSIICACRQKRSLNVFQISDPDVSCSINKLWGKKVNEDKFLTCCNVSDDCSTVFLTDSADGVHVYDVEQKRKIFGYSEKKSLRDKWTQIISKDNILYLADRNTFSSIDFRDFSAQPILVYDPSKDVNICEDICSLTFCGNNSNYLYLGTNHNVIQVDIRKKKSIQRWTHLMKQPPQFMSCLEECSNDLLIVQSPQISETVGITNEYIKTEEDFNYLSDSLPCALNGIKRSLKLSRLNGLCLNPFVAERFNFTVTGIQLVQNDYSQIHLFTANSGGDIFFSRLTKGESNPLCDRDSTRLKICDAMKMYETHFDKMLPLKFAKKRHNELNMSHLIEDFRNVNVPEKRKRKSKFCWKYDEMFEESSLRMYKDVLAEKILAVWNIKADDDKGDDDDVDEDDVIRSSTAKVQEWMSKT